LNLTSLVVTGEEKNGAKSVSILERSGDSTPSESRNAVFARDTGTERKTEKH
jgi:hypothetical protein